MSLAIWFYLCMFLWLVFGAAPIFKSGERNWTGIGLALLPFLAVLCLGYAVFGSPIK